MTSINLFSEPFDLDQIEAAIEDDDFMHLAFVMLGREPIWRASLRQLADLVSLYEESGRDQTPIFHVVSVMIQRAAIFQKADTMLDELTMAIGLLPSTKLTEEIKTAHLKKTNPTAWQRERDRKWVETYSRT